MKKLWVIGCLLALFGFGTAAAGESMFGVPWSYRVRKGAQGAVKIAADGISVRRDNADGEIVALSNKGFPVEPGAIYRVSYRLIGPKNGEVTPQAPIPGRRPFPSAVFYCFYTLCIQNVL